MCGFTSIFVSNYKIAVYYIKFKSLILNFLILLFYIKPVYDITTGNVIFTGTSAGVGLGMKSQIYLKEGDAVEQVLMD